MAFGPTLYTNGEQQWLRQNGRIKMEYQQARATLKIGYISYKVQLSSK